MRFETDSLQAPSKFNGSYQENGANTLAERIAQGLQFQCVRHPEEGQVSSQDCIQSARRLCRECATGQTIRRKNGLREPSWFAPIDIQIPKSEVEMAVKKKKSAPKIITCPECGRENVREKARGVCTRCYNYVAAGKPVPPLEEVAPASQAGLVRNKPQEARITKPEAPEQIGNADDFEPFMAVGPSDDDDELDQLEMLVIDLSPVVDQGFAERDEVLQIMADFAGIARRQVRTPEAEVFALMRGAVRMLGLQEAAKAA